MEDLGFQSRMDVKAPRRFADRSERSVFMHYNNNVCSYWLAGRCNRNPCRFIHGESLSASRFHGSVKKTHNVYEGNRKNPNVFRKNSFAPSTTRTDGLVSEDGFTPKAQDKVCDYWVSSNCVKGDKCRFLHSWSRGDGFSMLTKLEGHKKAITGITLPLGSDKLYSVSNDGTARLWDCNSGQCVKVINLGAEIGSLISEGPWVFVGLPNLVKAWNVQTAAEISLDGPVGQVYALAVANDILFAGAQDGAILAWKGSSENNSFKLAASLKGHTRAVLCLVVGAGRLYSGSLDSTIKVWDPVTLQSIMTLNGHSGAVMSLICWDQFLLSCSLDRTIKVWNTTEEGNLEVAYSRDEEHGVLALCGIMDAEAKPILCCSCNDSSVRLYELPLFIERGRLFSKREVRDIQTGPGGLFFTGDGTGSLTVWNLSEKPTAMVS